MKIYTAPSFNKALKQLTKRQPKLLTKVKSILKVLQNNPEDPKLKLHKLTGKSEGWSVRVNYKIRITFYFDKNSLVLTNIGSHNQVY